MIELLAKACTLGLSAAASPGPFQAFLLAESVQKGFKRSISLAFAPLLSDGPIIILVSLVLSRAPDAFLTLLQIAGGLFILYLAYGAFMSLRKPVLVEQEQPAAYPGVLKATLTNFLNPNPWIFWTVLGAPLLLQAWQQHSSLAIGFLLGFYLTMITVLIVLIFVFSRSAKLGPKFSKGLLAFSVVALTGFGVFQIITGFSGLR